LSSLGEVPLRVALLARRLRLLLAPLPAAAGHRPAAERAPRRRRAAAGPGGAADADPALGGLAARPHLGLLRGDSRPGRLLRGALASHPGGPAEPPGARQHPAREGPEPRRPRLRPKLHL